MRWVVRSSRNSQGMLVQIVLCNANFWGIFHCDGFTARQNPPVHLPGSSSLPSARWRPQNHQASLITVPILHVGSHPTSTAFSRYPLPMGAGKLQRAPTLLFPSGNSTHFYLKDPFWRAQGSSPPPACCFVYFGRCLLVPQWRSFCASPDKFFVGATPAKPLMCWAERSPKECPCLSSGIGAKSCSPPKITPLKSGETLTGTRGNFGHWNMKVNFTP